MKKLAIMMTVLIGLSGLSFIKPTIFKIPDSGKSYKSIEAEIDKLVREAMGKEIPGLTVAVSKKGKMVYSKGFGYANYKKKTPMKRTHRTKIGSVSKILTALGIMKLTEEKSSFNLNKKLYYSGGIFSKKAYSNAIKKGAKKHDTPISWYKSMRLKHLLSHTVGYDWSGDRKGAAKMFNKKEDEVTYGQIHQYMLSDRKVAKKPGTKYHYSNHAVGLCGHIIHSVTGKPYGKYIDTKILKPLGLSGKIVSHTHKRDKYDSYAHSYNKETKKITTKDWEEKPGDLDKVSAAGGWAASAESMIRVMVATDKLSNHKDILKKETIDLMEKRPYPSVSSSHAIGWGYGSGGKKLSHSGSIGGGRAIIVKFKKGFTSQSGIDISDINIAICANSRPFENMSSLANGIAKVVGKADIPSSYDLLKDVSGSYIGVWRATSKKDKVWVGTTWKNFTKKSKEYTKDGYRLIDVDTYLKNGKRLYNGVWEKGSGKYALYQYDNWDSFVKKWKTLNGEGQRLIDIETFKSGTKRYYVGVWRGGSGKKALYQYDTWDKFVAKWKTLNGQGQRLVDIETFKAGNKRYYVGVWKGGTGKKALYQFDSWKKFNSQWKKLNGQGQRLIDIETFKVGSKRYYVGVWQAGKDGFALWHNADWNHFKSKREEYAQQNKYLVDMERF